MPPSGKMLIRTCETGPPRGSPWRSSGGDEGEAWCAAAFPSISQTPANRATRPARGSLRSRRSRDSCLCSDSCRSRREKPLPLCQAGRSPNRSQGHDDDGLPAVAHVLASRHDQLSRAPKCMSLAPTTRPPLKSTPDRSRGRPLQFEASRSPPHRTPQPCDAAVGKNIETQVRPGSAVANGEKVVAVPPQLRLRQDGGRDEAGPVGSRIVNPLFTSAASIEQCDG